MSAFLRQLDSTLEPPKPPPAPKPQETGTSTGGFFARIRLDIIPTKPQIKPTANATPPPPRSPVKESAGKVSLPPVASCPSTFPNTKSPSRRRSLDRSGSSTPRQLHHRRAVALSREPTIDPIAELSPAELLLLEQGSVGEDLEDEEYQRNTGTGNPAVPGTLDKDLPPARCGPTLEELLAQRQAALKDLLQAKKAKGDPASIVGLEQGLSDLDNKIKAAREQLQSRPRWIRKNLFGRFLG